MTSPAAPAPVGEIQDCVAACARWLQKRGAKGETPFDLTLEVLNAPKANQKTLCIAHLLYWLQLIVLPAVTKLRTPDEERKLGKTRMHAVRKRDELVARLAPRLRAVDVQLHGLCDDVAKLGQAFLPYDEAMLSLNLLYLNRGAGRPDKKDQLVTDLMKEDPSNERLYKAYEDAIAAMHRLRLEAEQARPHPQGVQLLPPRTLADWRDCRRILEINLGQRGFTIENISEVLPDGKGDSAARARMRRARAAWNQNPPKGRKKAAKKRSRSARA